jgi:hypothetical protein
MNMNERAPDVVERIIDQMFQVKRGAVPPDHVPGHLISLMILLATWDDLLADVFPGNGVVNPDPLYREAGVDPKIVTLDLVKRLLPFREHFAVMQLAWLRLTEYTDPPCLDVKRMRMLVDFTKTLKP